MSNNTIAFYAFMGMEIRAPDSRRADQLILAQYDFPGSTHR